MTSLGTKTSLLRVPARVARAALWLLALAFLLNAADPTPRFLGMRRATWLQEPTSEDSRARAVLPRYVLPPAVKPTSEGTTSTLSEIAIAPSQPHHGTVVVSILDDFVRKGTDSLRATASSGNGLGPPLRC